MHKIFRNFALPASLYTTMYCIFTYPLLRAFSTHYFCGDEDGYQNIWNLWWVNKAVTELHQLPWYTNYLHYPRGTSLIAHTLAPINGFIGILLQRFLTLNQTFNAIVIFSFVMTGVTTFWLARRLAVPYAGSLFAGAAFTFSQFHFAHAQNHLQIITLEWVPLAILAIYELLSRPTLLKGVAAAGATFLVAMTDFHFTFYVALTATLLGLRILARAIPGHSAVLARYIAPLCLFLTLTAATTGVFAWKLLQLNRTDRLLFNHEPLMFSTDVIDPFVPGVKWRFANLTKGLWSRVAAPHEDFAYIEHSLYVGWTVLLLCTWAVIKRKSVKIADVNCWFVVAIGFFFLSLGPRLHVAGAIIERIPLAYSVLNRIFPPINMGGMPMRMMVMVFLTTALIAGAALSNLQQRAGRSGWFLLVGLSLMWIVENLPSPQPTTPAEYPLWVQELRKLPSGAVIDTTHVIHFSLPLYYATGHGKPIAEGYISRSPTSVERQRLQFLQLVNTEQWDVLGGAGWNFRYIVSRRQIPGLKEMVRDGDVRVYGL